VITILEGILQIGEVVKSDNPILSFIGNLQPTKQNKQLHVLRFNFLTEENSLEIDINEEMDSKTAEKYLYVGRTGGSRSAQWYVSSTSSNYHLSETIYNLSDIDLGEKTNEKIQQILSQYYVYLGDDLINKYRYILDLNKYGIIPQSINEIYDEVRLENPDGNVGREVLDRVQKGFEDYLREEKGLSASDIGLYTILIDNEPLSDLREYQNAVIESKQPKSKRRKKFRGVCSICGATENVSPDMTETKIKFYTTNQIIFGSDLSKNNYYKNMQMCMDCLFRYLAGENYIMNKLQTKLADFNVYIIPQFVYGQPLNERDLDIATTHIVDSFNMDWQPLFRQIYSEQEYTF